MGSGYFLTRIVKYVSFRKTQRLKKIYVPLIPTPFIRLTRLFVIKQLMGPPGDHLMEPLFLVFSGLESGVDITSVARSVQGFFFAFKVIHTCRAASSREGG